MHSLLPQTNPKRTILTNWPIYAAQGISKGIIYHYFRTKDDLFLSCVEECFLMLKEHLTQKMQEINGDGKEQLAYQRIFCEAMIAPPSHVKNEIQERKTSIFLTLFILIYLNL
ncbi:TetR/AcrR family transcriptional regulator [Clostridiaceae bacterium]|nr:TetR/AcrR family transcriptional regulator [Clostridiaceae bacterium]RKI14334.1 TetR/AcrR family transcriptional regulator [bacterium 1XD21-70]